MKREMKRHERTRDSDEIRRFVEKGLWAFVLHRYISVKKRQVSNLINTYRIEQKFFTGSTKMMPYSEGAIVVATENGLHISVNGSNLTIILSV